MVSLQSSSKPIGKAVTYLSLQSHRMSVTDAHHRHWIVHCTWRTHNCLDFFFLTGLSIPTLKAVHTTRTKTLRRLLARVGTAMKLPTHSPVGLLHQALLDLCAEFRLDTAAVGEVAGLVVAHINDVGRL